MSSQSLKVCLKKEIHRIAKSPATYQALIDTITPLFGSRLPEKWTLQYADSDEDTIMMSNEQDYKEFIEDTSSTSKKAVKIFIVPLDGHLRQSNVTEAEIKLDGTVVEDKRNDNEESEPVAEEETASMERSSGERFEDDKIISEAMSRTLKSERCANKIISKLAQSNGPEMHPRLKAKLREVGKVLPQEKKEELERKKEKILNHAPSKENSNKASAKRPGNKVVHDGVRCDGCFHISFSGIRYKCSVCPDFDYCERCEAKKTHPHPFIQMKKEEEIYNNSSSQSSSDRPAFSQKAKQATTKKWKPVSSTLASFLDTFENEDNENAYVSAPAVERNSQQEINNVIQQIYASEIEEKTQKLQEVFSDKHPLRISDFVAHFHYLSLEGLIEKGLVEI